MELKALILYFIDNDELRHSLLMADSEPIIIYKLPEEHITFFEQEDLIVNKYKATESGTRKWKELNFLGRWLAEILAEVDA